MDKWFRIWAKPGVVSRKEVRVGLGVHGHGSHISGVHRSKRLIQMVEKARDFETVKQESGFFSICLGMIPAKDVFEAWTWAKKVWPRRRIAVEPVILKEARKVRKCQKPLLMANGER